jgi:hypothetical protein
MSTETKTLAQMTAEVVENNTAKGWYENCATFPEAMALLHSEVSEALDAWRKAGLRAWKVRKLESVTLCPVCQQQDYMDGREPECPDHPDKPEGVPSEFADIFIRLLDDAWLFGKIDLEAVASPGRFGINDSFAANMNTLHILIATASMAQEFAYDDEDAQRVPREFGRILTFLRQLCEHYGIDLLAEYERKMKFNRSRPYRHGGKAI